MPKVIYPAGRYILNTPTDSRIIPEIAKISSAHLSKTIPVPLKIFTVPVFNFFKNFFNSSPPYAAVLLTSCRNSVLLSI